MDIRCGRNSKKIGEASPSRRRGDRAAGIREPAPRNSREDSRTLRCASRRAILRRPTQRRPSQDPALPREIAQHRKPDPTSEEAAPQGVDSPRRKPSAEITDGRGGGGSSSVIIVEVPEDKTRRSRSILGLLRWRRAGRQGPRPGFPTCYNQQGP